MPGVQVRPAQPEDADVLAVIHVRAWQAAYRRLVPQDYLDRLDPAERLPQWRRWLRDEEPPTGTLVLVDDGAGVIGFITVSPSRDADTDPLVVGQVMSVYLLPAYWRRGGGRRLMEAALRRLADAGRREAVLWVLESNQRARRFYEAGGWRADGAVTTDTSRGFPLVELRYRRGTGPAG